jgi:hypothetical protein
MAKAKGTVEWFRHRKRSIIEHVKAIDDFAFTVRSFRALMALGPDGSPDVQAALHSAGVVSYARPFSGNKGHGGSRIFPKNRISTQPGFRDDIHRELLLLRDKLIAHSDPNFAAGRLFVKTLELKFEATDGKWPVGALVMTGTVHTLRNPELLKAYLVHSEAALQGAWITIRDALQEYALATFEHPESAAVLRAEMPDSAISAAKFSLTPEEPNITIQHVPLAPDQHLSPAPLEVGKDGYYYRTLSIEVNFAGELGMKMPDGSDFQLRVSPSPSST